VPTSASEANKAKIGDFDNNFRNLEYLEKYLLLGNRVNSTACDDFHQQSTRRYASIDLGFWL
jgi:hypothetical protein